MPDETTADGKSPPPGRPTARIGLFGGSFDPPHLAHVEVAARAREACSLDQVVFIPCRRSPHKDRRTGATGDQRCRLLALALAGLPWAQVSRVELERDPPSFSWMTVEWFREHLGPGCALYWILGADQWRVIESWARPERLAELLTFVVYPRGDDFTGPKPGFRSIALADAPGLEVSATEIRRRIGDGEPTDGLLDPAVRAEADRLGLYRAGGHC